MFGFIGRLPSLLALAATISSLCIAAPVNEPRALLPQFDAFYQPPAGFESAAPGTILKQRQVIAAFFGLVPNPVEAYQLLYRTTAIDGSAIATVTTVFKPLFAKNDRYVSFQTAYDSAAPICNPSYEYQLGSFQADLISGVETLVIEAYLLSGYIVASSDYEGPDVAFSAGRLSGTGVLDGMRAVANFKKLGFTTTNPLVVGVGYSGGAIATGWAASLQPTYAPELAIKGWVSGGTPANLTGTLVYIDNTPASGFIPVSIAGLTKPSAYGATLRPLINQIATAKANQTLQFANENCAPADLLNFFNQSVFSYDYQSLGPNLLQNPLVASTLQQNIMGLNKAETPTAPVLLYHGSADEIIPYANASTLAKTWCRNGANVNFTTYPNGGHGTTEILGLPAALDFVSSAFAGTVPNGCPVESNSITNLDSQALGSDLEGVRANLSTKADEAGVKDANLQDDPTALSRR